MAVTNKHEIDGAQVYENALQLTNKKLKVVSLVLASFSCFGASHSRIVAFKLSSDKMLFDLLHGRQQPQPQQQLNLMEGMDPPPELFSEN